MKDAVTLMVSVFGLPCTDISKVIKVQVLVSIIVILHTCYNYIL